jgi:hypothetical protein
MHTCCLPTRLQIDEPCEAVWQSAVGCLSHLTTHGGHWVAASLASLPPAAAGALLDACVRFNWSQELHARLVQMAVNLLYVSCHHHAGGDRQQQQQQQQQCGEEQQQQHGHSRRSSRGSSGAGEQQGAPTSMEHVSLAVAAAAAAAQHQHHQQQHSPEPWAQHSQWGDLDLPALLHAGPVDEQQLAAFGGAPALLRHFCAAASVEAQRTLLVPLLQVLMPHDAPDTGQLALLQVLCASPDCLAALQTALVAGVPGWSHSVVAAVTQQVGAHGVDWQLLAGVLTGLEQLAVQAASVTLLGAGLGPAAAGAPADDHQQQQLHEQPQLQLPHEVAVAMQVTLQQLWGQLPCQPHLRPGLQGQEEVVFQVPSEVQGCWKALRALCWCDDELARRTARHWLQQVLAVTLRQSLKVRARADAVACLLLHGNPGGTARGLSPALHLLSTQGAILLPLPGVKQRTTGQADAGAAAAAAAVTAGCDALTDVLSQLVVHCPRGSELLVDALQLHITSSKLAIQMQPLPQQLQQLQQQAAAGSSSSGSTGGASSPQQGQKQQQQQRAAVARECVQAWAFVCQWVMQARVSTSQAALTRLAAMAHSLTCVLEVPECYAAAELNAAGGHQQRPAAAVHDSSESLALPGTRGDDLSGSKAMPPLQLSSEPPSLLQAAAAAAADISSRHRQPGLPRTGTGAAAGAAVGGGAADGSIPAAAVTALATAEAVCWPQAFLLGRAVMVQVSCWWAG